MTPTESSAAFGFVSIALFALVGVAGAIVLYGLVGTI